MSSEVVVGLELGPGPVPVVVGLSNSRISGWGFLGFRPRLRFWSTISGKLGGLMNEESTG